MVSNTDVRETNNKKIVLSTVWICVLFNYLYADVFSLIANPALREVGARMTERTLLGWAVVMQTAIAMVLLSRLLPYKPNRWANIITGILHTAIVAWSLWVGMLQLYYVFFASVEIACTLFIIWYAWTWKPQHVGPPNKSLGPTATVSHSGTPLAPG
jgi:hypothetical protein